MIYSTTRCPHCKALIRSQTNPVFEIACPFEKCPSCNNIYKNSYKEEWITKSPLKRFMFLALGNSTWARALIIPLFCAIPIGVFLGVAFMWIFYFIGFFAWTIVAYYVKKKTYGDDIRASIIRTKDKEYVKLLKKAGYTIYPLD